MILEEEKARCEGFLGSLLGEPVRLPPVRFVEPEDIEGDLRQLVEDALQGKSSTVLRPLRLWLEGRLLRSVSGKVLGIYTQRIFSEHESEILLSRSTLQTISSNWNIPEEVLLRWVLSHEGFHAFQLQPGLPLRQEMRQRTQRLLRGEGGMAELMAAMTWIEGSADWVMDRPGLLRDDEIQSLREMMIRRRHEQRFSPLMLLLRSKRNQYEKGRLFAEQGWKEVGAASLCDPVLRPELLPRPGEEPGNWARRLLTF